jgi:hypothetical protein
MSSAYQMSVDTLGERCCAETERFRVERTSDPAYCFELWRRALHEGADAAWRHVMLCFGPTLLGWIRYHPCAVIALRARDERSLADEAFARMAEANLRASLRVETLPQLLKYLKLCVHAVIMMEVRGPQPPPIPADLQDRDRVVIVEDQVDAERLWQRILSCTANEHEARVVTLRWLQDYKPAEIVQQFPDDFPDVREIYTILARVVACCRKHLRRPEAG